MRQYLQQLNTGKDFVITLILAFLFFSFTVNSQKITYNNSWSEAGIKLQDESKTNVDLVFSIKEFTLNPKDINGEEMIEISLPGNFLPNNEGAPDLPAISQYIAIPQGAKVSFEIVNSRVETYKDVNIAPAPRIPKANEDGPLYYQKNAKIYTRDAFYPNNPVEISELTSIRGVDAVILGITPYQYNPVTKELLVYRDLKIKVKFEGGNGQFGENRLRSRFFDPILSDLFANYNSLPKIDYYKPNSGNRTPDYEYIIISPDDPTFLAWADSIKLFRTMQGISTGVFTTADVGGNTSTAIESFINDAFTNWDVPPVACLLIGDYGSTGNTIVSPIWDGYCVSDNIYADVSNNDMPDVIFARMTAQNATHLERMIGRALNYERNPPTSADFYNHPVTALGWQTERWFQICSESVGGYFKHVHGKDPVRINEIYSGSPGAIWSTATNTSQVVDYFGPAGEGYIPLTPAELGGWSGGTSSDVTNAINDGAFILQHRDHGSETGWGEPSYNNNNIDDITTDEPTFIFSINCLTGKYNWSNECFAEKWHRHEFGCLGIIAASEISYSFVNDTYVWGMYDNMWPDFMPDTQTDPEPRGILPAFGNAGGKYFLQQSNWPYNTGNKEVTYNLFHHHGDAFTELYSEVPQNLTVAHDAVLLAGLDYFTVTADDGSIIALSVNGELLGVGEGTGGPVDISIVPQYPPAMVDVVVTKTNYYRYHAQVQVIPPSGPYVIKDSYTINDQAGNNNGQADYGETIKLSIAMKNVGSEDGIGVQVNIMSTDPYVTITDAQEDYGNILAGETVNKTDGFEVKIAGDVPDNYQILIDIEATDGTDGSWSSSLSLPAFAPNLQLLSYTIDDAISGNGNGKFDAGETVDIVIDVTNTGSADAYNVIGELVCNDTYVTINSGTMPYGDLNSGNSGNQAFSATSSAGTPPGYHAIFELGLSGDMGLTASDQFDISIGQIPVLIVDFDGNNNSGPKMKVSIDNIGVACEYSTTMPPDPNLYSSIFVCLGIYSDNHQLTEAEGIALKDFLDAGNKLYMEGGDTWYYDPQRAVHPYFSINGVDDGSNDLGTLNGQTGTFTEGMTYNYLGDNNWIDNIEPTGSAFKIFQNQNPSYGTAVAKDAGTYKTIGSSFEFGGLANGTSTRDELMEEYLNFFGFHGAPEAPPCPDGPTEMCQGAVDVEYTTNKVPDALTYFWSVDPATAGVFSGSDTIGNIAWDPNYSGTAYIHVCAINGSGQGPLSIGLEVTVNPNPTVFLTGTTDLCLGDSTELTFDLTGAAPWTVIMNGGAFSYTFNSTPANEWVKPTATTDYIVSSVTDVNNCVNTGIGNALITLIDIPNAADIPNGPNTINTSTTPSSSYTINNIANADSYTWSITPSNAGQITPNGTSCDVSWEISYIGTATLIVKGSNTCGDGAEGILQIGVNSQGILDFVNGLGVNIYPNPSKGICSIEIVSSAVNEINLKVINTIGTTVYTSENITFNGNYSGTIDLSDQSEGMYFVVLESEAGKHIQKVIIQR